MTKLIDSHTHCIHSADGVEAPRQMIETAIGMGAEYIAFTDHCDYDFDYCDLYQGRNRLPQIDFEKHCAEIEALKSEYAGRIEVALGVEFGYNLETEQSYRQIAKTYPFDVIINSIHLVENDDIYRPRAYEGKEKRAVYEKYLRAILASVKAPFAYDIIGHIGYIARRAPYTDKLLRYSEFPDLCDEILKEVIARGKSLEVNSQTVLLETPFLPEAAFLKRYRELGGELVTFGSDAHTSARIGEKYHEAVELLKQLGFSHIQKYIARKPHAVKI